VIEATITGDVGYRVGRYELKAPDGAPLDRGKYIEIWHKIDGEWKIGNDIWNSDLPSETGGESLIITHEVTDNARWLAAWQNEGGRHELFAQHGAPKVVLLQSPDNPKHKALWINVTDMAAFEAFMASPETAAAKKADGVRDSTLRVFLPIE